MNKQNPPKHQLLLSLSYWFGAHSLGLLLHPYQSIRRLVRDEFYRPLIWLPSVTGLLWWLVGGVIARFNVLATLRLSIVARAIDAVSIKQLVFSIIFLWGIVFLGIWQIILFYLYHRIRETIVKS